MLSQSTSWSVSKSNLPTIVIDPPQEQELRQISVPPALAALQDNEFQKMIDPKYNQSVPYLIQHIDLSFPCMLD